MYVDKYIKKDIFDVFRELNLNPQRIAVLTPQFTLYDGISRVVEQQAKDLSAKGLEVTVFTFETSFLCDKKNKQINNITINIIKAPHLFLLNRIYRILFLFDLRNCYWSFVLRNYDVIIAHQYPMTFLAFIAKRIFGVPYLFYDHGQFRDTSKLNIFESSYQKFIYFMEDITIKSADSFISVSCFLRNELLKRINKNGFVVYNWIPQKIQIGYNDNFSIRKNFGLEEENKLILFVGRIVPHKGIHNLINAFRIARRKLENLKLVIVGMPYYKPYFKKLELMSSDDIVFTGGISDNELNVLFDICDIYATCSQWEGFDLPVAEAQLHGKPVVAFNIGSHAEIVNNGILVQNGDIYSFADALVKLLSHENNVGDNNEK